MSNVRQVTIRVNDTFVCFYANARQVHPCNKYLRIFQIWAIEGEE